MRALATIVVVGTSTVLLSSAPAVRTIPYRDARPILESLRQDLIPAELRATTAADLEAVWPAWVSRHGEATRVRIERGNRDSIVNFLLFGTTFTSAPRATEADLAALGGRGRDALSPFARRIDDLAAGIASPGANERLQFARRFVERLGMDPGTADGRAAVRTFLGDSLLQAPVEVEDYAKAVSTAKAQNESAADLLARTLFRERGLSTDTSILVDFALDRTLEAVKAAGLFQPRGIRRVGIVGPGLDFIDKHNGYDFYAEQTIQPFAVIDSLVRLGLAEIGAVRLTTFDVNERVTAHLEAARDRARQGGGYVLVLPRAMDAPWTPGLVSYWERFGARIGKRAGGVSVPPNAGRVQARAVRVGADVVRSIEPQTLNIVLERLEGLDAGDRFDVIVATDVLIYYDVFDQSLALTNLAAMLRPGGLLLTNNRLFELPAIPMEAIDATDVVHMPMPGSGDLRDRVLWYRRQ